MSGLHIGRLSVAIVIISALENDVLRSLIIPVSDTPGLNALVRILPKLKRLRKLHLFNSNHGGDLDMQGTYDMMVQAFKCNCSLWQDTTHLRGVGDWNLSDSDKTKMEFYAKRNKQIHTTVKAPTDKLLKLRTNWPRTFLAIRGCEMEASIILLALAALGDAVGPQDHSLKRKREE